MVLVRNNLKLITVVLVLRNTKHSRSISVCSGCWRQNHYEILGVSKSCNEREIKNAFLKKIKLLHPDRNAQNPKYHDLVIEVNEAYGVLSKAQRRALYDQQLIREEARGRHFADPIKNEYSRTPFRDLLYELARLREDSKYKDEHFYGIRTNMVPGTWLVGFVIIFTIIGVYDVAKCYLNSFSIVKISSR